MPTPLELHLLFQCTDLRQLVECSRPVLTNPLILTDLTHRVLEMSDEPNLTDPKWVNINRTKRIPLPQAVSDVYYRSFMLKKPVIDKEAADNINILRLAISHANQLIGFMEVPCYYGTPDQEEQELLQFIADIACLIMKRDLGYLNSPASEKEFFISDLLEGRITDEHHIQDRCRHFQLEIDGTFQVITVSSSNPSQPLSRAQLDQYRGILMEKYPTVTGFVYGDHLKLIAPIQGDSVNDGNFFLDLIHWLTTNQLQAGASHLSSHLSDIAECNRQSNKALEIGQLLKSSEILLFYDKYSVYSLLEQYPDQENLTKLCHSAIFTLAEYDLEHNTALLETLHAYLYSQKNMTTAAATLYIHRNTLVNRMTKINDLIHTDLEDCETVFHLLLSYHILEFFSATVAKNYDMRMKESPTLRHQ